jgi:flagellar hook protein FlgE
MSLSSAMLTGYTGIRSNSVAVDTVGDNLANVNTTAFKGQRTLFETLLYQTVREGEPPSSTSGGTLPFQIGRGSGVAVVQRNFGQGAIESTSVPSDLAIDGDGFFVLDRNGERLYTRDGAFHLDASQTMVSNNGDALQVFPADNQGIIQAGTLSDLVIPLGATGQVIPTSEVIMRGQLDAGTLIATQPSITTTQPLLVSSGAPATSATPLSSLVNIDGVPLFAEGDVLRINGSKGGLAIPESTFVIGQNGSTLGEFSTFLNGVLGINTDPATGGLPGVAVGDGTSAPAGALVVTSNLGEANAVRLDANSVINTTGAIGSPFVFQESQAAVGGGLTTTSFNVFDSLGNPADVRLRMALESKSDSGTTWRFYAESIADSDDSVVLGTGTLSFDPTGRWVGAAGTDLSIDRAATGAASPLTFSLDFSRVTGFTSSDGSSQLTMASQNGAPAGVVTGYTIDSNGIVTLAYSNQLTEVVGQVALATFTNNEGLMARSDNVFVPGANSGDPVLREPNTGTAGAIRAAALEQSNVEIAREFLNLITASTGISSAGRVVRVANELLAELLLIVR